MSRFAPVVPAALLVLALTGCTGSGDGAGVQGSPGAAGVRDPFFAKAGNGGYDVGHYDLRLAYDPARHHLTGTATITARATQDLSAFDLDLKGLDVETVTVEGRPARFNRAGQEVTVRPAEDLDRGETFQVTVRYAGSPLTVTDPDGSKEGWLPTADGALALGEPVGSMAWYPGNHHPSDKATYDITVTVPDGLTAVSNGELRGRTTSGGRTTFAWHTAEPMASYVTTLAIGRYEVSTPTVGERRLPAYIAVDPVSAADSKKVLARLPEIMDWLETNFGPYPFSSTGAIVDRAEDAGYALETQNRPVFPGPPETVTLVVHELAHQWYGDSVTPKTWRDMWLNESFATYAEWLWDEDHGGASAEETFQQLYAHGEEKHEELWDFPPADPGGPEHVSADPVYQRGAMVLHKIRQAVGDDAFYDIVQGWAAAHRHGNASTADFTAFVEHRNPDVDFSGIWKDWLYGDGKPARP